MAVVGVLAFLSAVLVNYATSLPLPESVKPYLWLSWPLAVLVTGISIWVAYRQSRSNPGSVTVGRTLDERNRSRMLDKVENFWIKGVLDQSLYQVARLELGLEQAPDKVEHPWRTILQEAASKREVPARTPIIELFDRLDGKLLILGAPGAGKTTMLLELARDLIARARQDPQHPIPLVFNLSTWASQRQPLDKWLADELNQRYDVPAKLAAAWIEADAVLPLLDGLDEVAQEQRDACVKAINIYRQKRGLVQLAVCSRIEMYDQLADKLRLEGAALIQPLPQQTVDAYLRQVGQPLAAVRTAIKDDPELQEMLDNPLLLSIVALAYKDKAPAKVRAADTPEERRRQLFDDYIAAMFARRGQEAPFVQQQTMRWLAWLASQMVQHKLTVCYIERMQPNWLPARQWRRYIHTASLVIGLVIALVVGLVLMLAGPPLVGLLFGLAGGLAGGLFFGSRPELFGIKVTETLKLSWSEETLSEIKLAGVLGLVIGTARLVLGLLELVFDPIRGFGEALARGLAGLLMGLGSGLAFAFIRAVGRKDLVGNEIAARTVPNQGISLSARYWLAFGLGGALLFGLGEAIAEALGQDLGLGQGLGQNLAIGLGVGLGIGLFFGGLAVIQHYTLRWLLYRNRILPLRLVPFLDYCAERIFLRKVGGGYIFVHRLLMEHFASLYAAGSTERNRNNSSAA